MTVEFTVGSWSQVANRALFERLEPRNESALIVLPIGHKLKLADFSIAVAKVLDRERPAGSRSEPRR